MGADRRAFRARSYESFRRGVQELLPAMALRLLAAVLFALAFTVLAFCPAPSGSAVPELWACVRSGPDLQLGFAEPRLRWVLLAFHLAAALGLDEHAVFSLLARRPFAARLLTPGSPVTPLLPGLPTTQSFIGATLYAGFVAVSARCLAVGGAHAELPCQLFLAACAFDLGLLIATRPADIFKFLVALVYLEHGRSVCLVLVGCLYFWSGVAKLRPFFFASVFPYQFLLPNPLLYFARGLYLDSSDGHRATTACMVFGLLGALGEAAVGLGIVFGSGVLRLAAMVAATLMHVFIFSCGIGPYRWNVMHLFLGWSCYWAAGSDGSPPLSAAGMAYIAAVGLLVPLLGAASPASLGRWCGGYRQATFHFAGNEMVHGLFIKRTLLERPGAAGRYIRGPLALLRLPAAPARLTEDDEFLRFPFLCDNFKVDAAVRAALCKVSGAKDLEGAEQGYIFVSLNWLNMHGALLNTKWDESVTAITQRYFELLLEELAPAATDVLVLTVHPIPLLATTKRWDMRRIGSAQPEHEGVVPAPWWPQQAAKDE